MDSIRIRICCALLACALVACGRGDGGPTGTPIGTLAVAVTTAGLDLDPDGYVITLEGGAAQSVGPQSSVLFADLPAGSATVSISGLAPNCSVANASASATVAPGATTNIDFFVFCSANQGSIAVTVASFGTDVDPDGYLVSLGTGPSQTVASAGSATFANVPVGSQTVTLSGLAPNCTISGASSIAVTVFFGTVATADFSVTCAANVGSVAVTTVTSGSSVDPNGYSVSVSGGSTRAIGVNETSTIGGVPIGSRVVTLSGVASNCTVAGGNTRNVNVTYGATTTASFTVTCVTQGTIAVTVTSPVSDFNGYTVAGSSVPAMRITPKDTLYFAGAPGTDITVVLSGYRTSCTVPNAARTVTFPTADTLFVNYAISCTFDTLIFTSDNSAGIIDVYSVNASGANLTQITNTNAEESDPSYSPDGSQIVASLQPAGFLVVMNSDGSNVRGVSPGVIAGQLSPAWHPNGTRLAFACQPSSTLEICLMNVDGTGFVRYASGAGSDDPAFSPDGQRIVYSTSRDGNTEIYVMNADGTNQLRLTNDPGSDRNPSFNKDGTKIIFRSTRSGNSEVYVMNADGTGVTRLTTTAVDEFWPRFSPDDQRISFTSTEDGVNWDLYVMNADGSGRRRVTTGAGADYQPSWKP